MQIRHIASRFAAAPLDGVTGFLAEGGSRLRERERGTAVFYALAARHLMLWVPTLWGW